MKMSLTGAIEILKLHKHTTDKFKHSIGDQYVSDAIDTVVKALEKPTYTAEDMEAFAEWLIGRNTEWISKLERNETSKILIKIWEETK
jgi:hypothetical protein